MLEIGGILLTEEQIQEKVKELAKQVEKEFAGRNLERCLYFCVRFDKTY